MKATNSLKIISIWLLLVFLYPIVYPTVAYGLTSGAQQPEATQFTPIGSTDMVDLFTGDFSYNIPLMDVGGYPINISYQAGIGMDQEASWVGLGWSLNPGALNRTMRGLPDDFNGDKVVKQIHRKANQSWGITAGADLELFGKEIDVKTIKTASAKITKAKESPFSLGVSVGYMRNTYTGGGLEFGLSPSYSIGQKNGGPRSLGLGLDVSGSSASGFSMSPSANFSVGIQNSELLSSLGSNIGISMNSRQGLGQLTLGVQPVFSNSNASEASTKVSRKDKNGNWVLQNKTGAMAILGGTGFLDLNSGATTFPRTQYPMVSKGFTFRGSLGTEIKGSDVQFQVSGYYNQQDLASTELEYTAYGYDYLENHASNEKYLLDFNREKDGIVSEAMQYLPVTNLTYDMYTAHANGFSTSFRPHRADVGTVSDARVSSVSDNSSVGLNFSMVDLVKGGFDVNMVDVNSSTHKWDNAAAQKFKFKKTEDVSADHYKPYYFRSAGEMTPINDSRLALFNKEKPIRVALTGEKDDISIQTSLVSDNEDASYSQSITPAMERETQRPENAVNIKALTAYEASYVGFDRDIKNHSSDGYVAGISRMGKEGDLTREPHHHSEFTVTNTGGMQYVYGVPTYNVKQKEVTFATDDTAAEVGCDQQVFYSGTDNSVDNTRGNDNFFQSQETPSYATSFLLSAVLSPDYQDITGDGVSDDDLGTAVKFNYSRQAFGTDKFYRWRTPYEANSANYNEGLRADNTDQKASYIYGEREVWYLQSLESKNFVARFNVEDRLDGKGVLGENGGLDNSQTLKYLKSIDLFSKEELKVAEAESRTPIPIKTTHFQYNYELCGNVLNNNGASVMDDVDGDGTLENINAAKGKLTLKRIWYTYGESTLGELSSYYFTYNGTSVTYESKSVDRWGSYKSGGPSSNCSGNTTYPLNEFPYADQNQTSADADVATWSLGEIQLPSGGLIKVTYEADDYGYVQNKRALRMFGIQDVRSDKDVASGNTNLEFYNDKKENANFLIFNLDETIAGTESQVNADRRLELDYDIEAGSKVLTRVLFNIRDNYTNYSGKQEYINGYAAVKSVGALKSNPSGDYDQGYVELEEVPINDRDRKDKDGNLKSPINPLVKNAFTFMRSYLPAFVNPGSEPKTTGESAIRGLANSFFNEIPKLAIGANRVLRNDDFARSAVPGKSTIRLADPDKKKLGGGLRVKQILVYDNWKAMTGQSSDLYDGVTGQVYTYTTNDGRDISSGVAANEPGMGSEENALRHWLDEKEIDKKGVVNDLLMYETPYGESYLPGPSVGYSNVTVRAYNPTKDDPNWSHPNNETIKATATGYSVHEFYTTREFPTIWKTTDIEAIPWNPLIEFSFLTTIFVNKLWLSQGHAFITNDMNGKPKGTHVYGEGANEFDEKGNRKAATASTEYIYNADPETGLVNSNLRSIDRDASSDYSTVDNEVVYNTHLGYTMDVVFDAMHSSTYSYTGKVQGNIDAILIGIIPGPIPMVWPTSSSSETDVWYMGCTKVIRQQGVLLKTVTRTNGIADETETEGYDKSSGSPLSSRTVNEFNQNRYSWTYPAHWYYENLGNKSARQDHYFENVSLSPSPDFDVEHNGMAISGLKNGDMVMLFEVHTETLTKGEYPLSASSYKEQHVSGKTRRILTRELNQDQFYSTNETVLWFSDGKLIDRSGEVVTDLGSMVQVDLKVINPVEKNNTAASIGSVSTLGSPLYDLGGTYDANAKVLNAGAIEYSDDWRAKCCGFTMISNTHTSPCGDGICDVVNPYLKGLKEQWRPKKNWFVVSDRTSKIRTTGEADIANDGILTDFNPFWTYSSGDWQMITNPGIPLHWDWATEITEYNDAGVEIENTNKLNIPTSAVYGYNNQLPVIVGTNAEYNELAFDGFEDYNYQRPISTQPSLAWVSELKMRNCLYPQHFGFSSLLHDDMLGNTYTQMAHTGTRSLAVSTQSPQTLEYSTESNTAGTADQVPFVVEDEDCFQGFKPKAGNEYTISCWTREHTASHAYTHPQVEVVFLDNNNSPISSETLQPEGPVIDGWQRVFGHFTIPNTPTACKKIQVKYSTTDPTNMSYFDDMRIYPKDGVVTTYVYHPDNLRLMAKLDENNYAALYEYDAEGNLVRSKKETERGVMTLQENRTHIQKAVQ